MIISPTCGLTELQMEVRVCRRSLSPGAVRSLRDVLVRDWRGRHIADLPLRSFVRAIWEAEELGKKRKRVTG